MVVLPGSNQNQVDGGSEELEYSDITDFSNAEQIEASADISIVELLDAIIFKALEVKASDVHFEPREDLMIVRFRVDGLLKVFYTLDKSIEQPLVFKIKVASKLRTDEHYAPQDGRIRFEIEDKVVDTRISILRTSKGEKVVIRLLTQEGRSFKLEDLGMRDDELLKIRKSYIKPHGMIIASGPTGSGKTTSLYSILKLLNSIDKNITTVEDPVEYGIEGVNQIQINPKANLTFASGLRSILRQDPDIIMVGEIRDKETASIAVNAAMTGHLVLSTIHTNDAVTTIPRLVDMGIEPYLVSSTVNLIIAQRLARKIDEKYKTAVKVTQKYLNDLSEIRPDIASLLKVGEVLYEPQGHEEVGDTGYSGRVGLYEVLSITETLRTIVTYDPSYDPVFKQARKEGLTLILEDGLKKARDGLISIDELIRITALSE